MKNLKLYSGLFLALAFLLGGCYTQVALNDNNGDNSYSNGNNNGDQYYQSESDSGYTNNNQYYDNQNQPYYNINLGFGNPFYRSYWGWYGQGMNFGFSYGNYYDPYYYGYYDPFYYSTWCSPYSFSYYYPYAGYYYYTNNPYNYYPYYYYSTNQISNRYGNSGGYKTRNNYGGRGSDGSRAGIRTGYGSFNKTTATNNTGRVYRTNGTQRGSTYTNGNRTRTSEGTYGRSQNRNTVREKSRNNNGGRSGRDYRSGNRQSYTPPPRTTYKPPQRTYSPPRSTYNPPRSYSPPPQSSGNSRGNNNRGGGNRSSSGRGR